VEVLRYRHLLLTEDSITSEHRSAYPRLTFQPIRVANYYAMHHLDPISSRICSTEVRIRSYCRLSHDVTACGLGRGIHDREYSPLSMSPHQKKKNCARRARRARKGMKKKISPEPEPARQSHRATEQDRCSLPSANSIIFFLFFFLLEQQRRVRWPFSFPCSPHVRPHTHRSFPRPRATPSVESHPHSPTHTHTHEHRPPNTSQAPERGSPRGTHSSFARVQRRFQTAGRGRRASERSLARVHIQQYSCPEPQPEPDLHRDPTWSIQHPAPHHSSYPRGPGLLAHQA
jgi:hypothetical protein